MQERISRGRYLYAFDSLREFGEYIERTPRQWHQRQSVAAKPSMARDLSTDYDGAVYLAQNGWIEGAQRAQDTLKVFAPNTPRPSERIDFYGHRPHVPRFCAGAPDSMVRHAQADTGSGKVLTLYVPVNALLEVDARSMSNFGVAVVQYINQLETDGTRVALYAAICSNMEGSDVYCATIELKRADQPLDLAVIAFAIGHPAMFRRLGFAARERCPARECYGYGKTIPLTFEYVINAPQGAVILNGMKDANRHARTPEQALEYVSKQIETALEAQ